MFIGAPKIASADNSRMYGRYIKRSSNIEAYAIGHWRKFQEGGSGGYAPLGLTIKEEKGLLPLRFC